MQGIDPKLASTRRSQDGHEWLPVDFKSFLTELEHIIASCVGHKPKPFFRGHADSTWLLDSTFVRNLIRALELKLNQRLSQELRRSTIFNIAIKKLLLMKFGIECKPHQELLDIEKKENVDPWFEFLKNLQQELNTDRSVLLKGTFFIDWTLSSDIGLFFANENRIKDGSLWIYDYLEKGTRYDNPTHHLIDLMRSPKFFEDKIYEPYILYPRIQIVQECANNQDSIYIAQLDYRYDLADIWVNQESRLNNRQLFINLILPDGTQGDCAQYLQSKGITRQFIYNKYKDESELDIISICCGNQKPKMTFL